MVYFIDGDNTNPRVTITVTIGRQEHTREFTRERVNGLWEIGADCCRWLESIGGDEPTIQAITWDAEHVGWEPENFGSVVTHEYQIAYQKNDGTWDIVETFLAEDDDAANAYATEQAPYDEWYVLCNGRNINAGCDR